MLVSKISFRLIPKNDLILPPMSSKVLKYLIVSGKLLSSLRTLVESKDKYKPLFISNLGTNGKRLLSSGALIKVKAGSILYADVAFRFDERAINEISEGIYSTPYGDFEIGVENINMFNLEANPKESEKRKFMLKFITPTLLSSKILLPPSLADKYKKIKVGFSVFPTIGLIIGSSYKVYVSLLGKGNAQEYLERGFKLSVLGEAFSEVYDFNLRPMSVIIGDDRKGKLRRSRGVVGWIKFDIRHKNIKRQVWKFLTVASYLGLGRSRGIGLGEVQFLTYEEKDEEKANTENVSPTN